MGHISGNQVIKFIGHSKVNGKTFRQRSGAEGTEPPNGSATTNVEKLIDYKSALEELMSDFLSHEDSPCSIFSIYINKKVRRTVMTRLIMRIYPDHGEKLCNDPMFDTIVDVIAQARIDTAHCVPGYEIIKYCPGELTDDQIVEYFNESRKRICQKEKEWSNSTGEQRLDSVYWSTLFNLSALELRFNYIIERSVNRILKERYNYFAQFEHVEKERIRKLIRFLVRVPDNLYSRMRAAQRIIELEDRVIKIARRSQKSGNLKYVISRAQLLYDFIVWETMENRYNLTIKSYSTVEHTELPMLDQRNIDQLLAKTEHRYPELHRAIVKESCRRMGDGDSLAGILSLWEHPNVSVLFCHTSKRLLITTITGNAQNRRKFITAFSQAAHISLYDERCEKSYSKKTNKKLPEPDFLDNSPN